MEFRIWNKVRGSNQSSFIMQMSAQCIMQGIYGQGGGGPWHFYGGEEKQSIIFQYVNECRVHGAQCRVDVALCMVHGVH